MLKKQVGSHRKLQRVGLPNFTFSFHDKEEVGPAALARIGKDTGLRPEDLRVQPFAGKGSPATVAEVEPLGGYTVVTLIAGDVSLRAMVRGQPDLRVGVQVTLSCDPAKVIYFGASGTTLPRMRGVAQ